MGIALITGATSGIGEATALKFAEQGWNLIITGRRTERLNALAQKIRQEYQAEIITLNFDISDHASVQSALNSLPVEWRNIDLLLNNAGGAAGRSLIQDGSLEDWETMINANVKGLLYVSKEIFPWMITRKQGHIINIGSIAAKEVYSAGNVYCATKFAVDALTKAMRIDLLPHNIRVTGIHPGAVETEFSQVRFKGDTAKAKAIYEGFTPLVAKDIADIIWFVASQPAHVNISDLVVMPTAQASTNLTYKNLIE